MAHPTPRPRSSTLATLRVGLHRVIVTAAGPLPPDRRRPQAGGLRGPHDARTRHAGRPASRPPTARALLALELVQESPGITADRLARKLGVSERAARSYVGILRETGIPIESVRGPYGGYRLGRGLRLPPLMFSAAEALGLVMAVLDGHHTASDPTDPVGNALGKIMRALPQPVATRAEAVRRTTAPAPDRAAARPDPETKATLVRACSDHWRVRLDYRSEAGSEWVAEVDPWAVVVRHGRWYLLCQRLVGSTSNPVWYAEQLAKTPASYRIVRLP